MLWAISPLSGCIKHKQMDNSKVQQFTRAIIKKFAKITYTLSLCGTKYSNAYRNIYRNIQGEYGPETPNSIHIQSNWVEDVYSHMISMYV